jgi:hypothetical protein
MSIGWRIQGPCCIFSDTCVWFPLLDPMRYWITQCLGSVRRITLVHSHLTLSSSSVCANIAWAILIPIHALKINSITDSRLVTGTICSAIPYVCFCVHGMLYQSQILYSTRFSRQVQVQFVMRLSLFLLPISCGRSNYEYPGATIA